MITTSKLNSSIVFSLAIFWGRGPTRCGPRSEGRRTQTRYFINKSCLRSYVVTLLLLCTNQFNYLFIHELLFIFIIHSFMNCLLKVVWIIDNNKQGKPMALKSGSHFSKKIRVICLTESPLKVMINTFHFILKAFSVAKYFSFCHDFLVM